MEQKAGKYDSVYRITAAVVTLFVVVFIRGVACGEFNPKPKSQWETYPGPREAKAEIIPDDGILLTLDNGAQFRVILRDREKASKWMVGDQLKVFVLSAQDSLYRIVNESSRDAIEAQCSRAP